MSYCIRILRDSLSCIVVSIFSANFEVHLLENKIGNKFAHKIFSATYQYTATIGHFEKYHNTLCLSPQILHKHCFQFLLGITKAPRENKNNAYAKFGVTNKEYYGIFRSGLY